MLQRIKLTALHRLRDGRIEADEPVPAQVAP